MGYINEISIAVNTKNSYLGVLVKELSEFKTVFISIMFIFTKIKHMLDKASPNNEVISGVHSPGVMS